METYRVRVTRTVTSEYVLYMDVPADSAENAETIASEDIACAEYDGRIDSMDWMDLETETVYEYEGETYVC